MVSRADVEKLLGEEVRARLRGVYPVTVKLATTDPASGQPVTFTLEPILLDQELSGGLGGIPYWEGACHVLDDKAEKVGSAYLELTGYVGSLADRFK